MASYSMTALYIKWIPDDVNELALDVIMMIGAKNIHYLKQQ